MMKLIKFALFCLTPLFSGSVLHLQAQDSTPSPIKVTETVHSDGTKTVMKSDPDNHSAEASTYNQADKLMQRIVFAVDDKGDAINGVAYSAKGTPLYKMLYKRDEFNRVGEVDTYSTTDKLLSRTVYHYDSKGAVAGIDTYDANGNQISNTGPGGSGPARKRGYSPTH